MKKDIIVSKTFPFEAAHQLLDYEGDCCRLHGHSYKLIVSIIGPMKEDGMVIDFKVIDEIVKDKIKEAFDHHYLNDTLYLTTAEFIASYFFNYVAAKLISLGYTDQKVYKITLYETEKCFVEVMNGTED